MKHLLKDITLTAICLMAAIKASAYDFEENDICYNILSEADKTCEVTHRDNYNIYFYFGEISIPQVANGYKVTAIGTSAFYGCDGLTSIEIPQGVTSIGSSAFCGCNGLTSIEIPQGVTDIGDDTFYGCFRLTSIEIPQGVTYIGNNTFSNCSALTSIEIPQGVTYIGNRAFLECDGLTSITIPQGVTYIGEGAFYGCDGLTSIEIPQGVTTIEYSAFSRCTGLTSIEIPQGVTSIRENTFYGCDGLKSIEIPQGVTVIEDYAFCGCSGLTSIEIPQGVTYIGEAAFSGCNGLKSVTSLSTIPPVAAYRAFDLGQQHDNDTLYVPAGSLEAYKNANEWEDFEIIIELAPTGIESATADGQLSVAATGNGISVSGAKGAVEVYTVGGALLTRTTATGGRTEIALPARGLYLVKVGKQILKVKR